MNYQKINGTKYDYVRIGGWDSGNLTINNRQIYWPRRASHGATLVESVCSKPCPKGQVKVSSSRTGSPLVVASFEAHGLNGWPDNYIYSVLFMWSRLSAFLNRQGLLYPVAL